MATDERRYSQVRRVDAVVRGQRIPLIAKAWPDTAEFRSQIAAIERAKRVFADNDGVCIPFIEYDTEQRVLLMQRIPDPSLESLAHCEISLKGLNLNRWRRHLEQACFSAGRWLHVWHQQGRGEASHRELLSAYLETRTKQLDVLDSADRRSLLKLVASLDDGPVSAVHGDYSPWNVLWSPQRTTVLDCGVNEWSCVSPYWDYQTMVIGLTAELRFATRSPARFFQRRLNEPLEAFGRGYGSMASESQPTRNACKAIRHLISYVSDLDKGRAVKKRAAWHRNEVRRALYKG